MTDARKGIRRIGPQGKRQIAVSGTIQRENLPLPHVEYPGLYGTFIGYRESADAPLLFCSCQERAITACLHMDELVSEGVFSPAAEYKSFGAFGPAFPPSLDRNEPPVSGIRYGQGLCHRCNEHIPGCLYCHEMYAAPFEQTFGWYLNIEMFNLGHNPMQFSMIGDSATAKCREIRAEAARAVRRTFGFPMRGARLTSEVIIYYLTRSAFRNDNVSHHYRPRFLQGLELDIFIPSVMVGIEYQGDQHFESMEHWGGENALVRTVERDERKQRLFKKHGIEILYCSKDSWKYTEDTLWDLVRRTAKKRRAGHALRPSRLRASRGQTAAVRV